MAALAEELLSRGDIGLEPPARASAQDSAQARAKGPEATAAQPTPLVRSDP